MQVEDALAAEINVIDSHGTALQAQMARVNTQIDKLEGAALTVATNLEDKRRGEQVRLLPFKASPTQPNRLWWHWLPFKIY
jgi:prefoldin subunit 5